MKPTVTLRKAGWTAVFPHPETGNRRQVVVESEEAGWILIQQEAQAAAKRQDEEQRSEVKQGPAGPTGGFTIQDACELSWKRRYRGTASADNHVIVSHYKRMQRYFGRRTQLAAVTSIWFNEWREDLIDEGLKNTTINRITATMRALRQDALMFNAVTDLPMWPKSLRVTKIKPRFLSKEEEQRMVAYWQAQGELEMVDIFTVRISTGCRWPETALLTPRDINQENNNATFWKTKNGEFRTVPMPKKAREVLIRRAAAVGMDEPLFSYSYEQYRKRFAKCVEDLRLPGRVKPHCTRHTMAARAVSGNVSTQQLRHWGGWKSTAALESYAHMDTQGLKHMQKVLEGFD